MLRSLALTVAFALIVGCRLPRAVASDAADGDSACPRTPQSEQDLRFWLENMYVQHRFSVAEMSAATGLSDGAIRSAIERFRLRPQQRADRRPGDPLVMLPYPGGRHPRLGFLDGAIRPQRETKLSVFTPWDPASYVVVDLPEAIWSNLGLTYLAHTHVPTIWTKQGIELPPQEWQRREDGSLYSVRRLPNGISFAATATARADAIRMKIELTNGTAQPLTGLRNQMCVMLGYARGFNAQTSENKVFRRPFAACRSDSGNRWIITAWAPCMRTWANPRCPCMHSDPQLPDCAPGEIVEANGYLWFYEGDDLNAELDRLAAETGWPADEQGAEPSSSPKIVPNAKKSF